LEVAMRRFALLFLAALAFLGAAAILLGQVLSPGRLRVHLGGNPLIAPGEVWGGDVLVIGGGLAVQGTVEGNVVVLGGPLRVGGRVGGDVVSLGGEAVLQGGSEVAGNVVALGGIRRAAAANVRGDILEGLFGRAGWVVSREDRPVSLGSRLGPALLATGVAFFLGLFLAWGLRTRWPRRSRAMVETLRRRLLSCLGLGLAGGVFLAVALPLLVLLLLVSLIGILAIPFLLLLVGLLYLLGLAVCGLALGEALVGRREGQPWLPPAVGLAVLVPLAVLPAFLLPWLGPAWAALLAGAGLGAMLLSRLGTLEAVPVRET
jgi:hypothetical protein